MQSKMRCNNFIAAKLKTSTLAWQILLRRYFSTLISATLDCFLGFLVIIYNHIKLRSVTIWEAKIHFWIMAIYLQKRMQTWEFLFSLKVLNHSVTATISDNEFLNTILYFSNISQLAFYWIYFLSLWFRAYH